MTSRALKRDPLLESTRKKGSALAAEDATTPKRQATVYDAVAGRVNADGFIRDEPFISSNRDTTSSTSNPVAPESVLFRRVNAPERYEEFDYYFANEALPAQALPDSDLLKALHCYTSEFYSRATADGGRADFRSMDETAMLAMGVLLEEACREGLGKTGDLVFTEGEISNDRVPENTGRGSVWKAEESVIKAPDAAVRSGKTRRDKRRRLNTGLQDQQY